MTSYSEWLRVINGQGPSPSEVTQLTEPRYILTSRDLAEFVHRDYPYQAFVNACLILLSYGLNALNPANPYVPAKGQTGFATFGAPDILDLVARVANEALKHAWYQKWLVHRRLRPEEFAGWIDNIKTGRDTNYPINPEILNDNDLLKRVFEHNKEQNLRFRRDKTGSYLLPQVFPEGCPTHTAYPSGHAVYAGACVTVLKALFKEDFPIPQKDDRPFLSPVIPSKDGLSLEQYRGPDTLTVGGELNKLAANIAIGRDAAGVHWRTDASEGLKLGEDVAICLLRDRKMLYNEPFKGFTLTKFDGISIVI